MDFYTLTVKPSKEGADKLFATFKVQPSEDLMVRGGDFYAYWDEATQLWNLDVMACVDAIDNATFRHAQESQMPYRLETLQEYENGRFSKFRRYMREINNHFQQLDSKLIFSNTEVKKTDYASKRLPYAIEAGDTSAWDELMDTLYAPTERAKIEWAIGCIVSGDSTQIQKFLVLYGSAGTGKSTVLNIVQDLFEGYTAAFDAKTLGERNNQFAMEPFKDNPLVAIQHDGDLSRIDDNTKLNSIVSHEEMPINSKFQSVYSMRINSFLMMGTNTPVKISDAKSGIIRRLIDVHPTGDKVSSGRYNQLMGQIAKEKGAIAQKCLNRYLEMGANYYDSYRPVEMMLQTDVFFNFIEGNYDIFKTEEGITLKRAYEIYRQFCEETGVDRILPRHKFRDELRNYYYNFYEKKNVGGKTLRSYYEKFKGIDGPKIVEDTEYRISLEPYDPIYGKSPLDIIYAEQPAQVAKESGFPGKKWDSVTTSLSDMDPAELHFVQVPEQHIVIDFDLVDEDGEKDLALNLAEASKWPPTYTELSKSGKGVHLHYTYSGEVGDLASVYDVGIEVKTLLGDASLRRKLTKCNSLPIATISSGLPKKEKSMLSDQKMSGEKALRKLIVRNLRKEIHPGTKPSIDFIEKILNDAYEDKELVYDVTDMRADILAFALRSSNQAETCLKTVKRMKFASEKTHEDETDETPVDGEGPYAFYDIEVYPNLFVICWKYQGSDEIVKMVNPTPQEVEELFKLRLVGFNNRRYDNHILYGAYMGLSQEGLYELSQAIIEGNRDAMYMEAYHLSYTDIYDFSSKKQGLKKFEIELGLHHMEMDIPWDEPVPEELWPKVVEYCSNDVIATEATFEAREQDFVAREILADVSGLTVNHTTQNHTAHIVFEGNKKPQSAFVYTDLSEEFPGYVFEYGKSTYKGEEVGEGGYVYAEPGIYENVALLDIASMHPTTIEVLNLFGKYTKNFSDLKAARMAIKHKNFDAAREMLDGKLAPFLQGAEEDGETAEALSYALKIVINIVYGLTSAKFPNPFKDDRNVDNIVAKRGALFMVDLKEALKERGCTVVHIKTDSVKLANPSQEDIDFVFEFGKQYGYDFEHEATYDKLCLVNDAVYIARSGDKWTAVGKQFQHPYVYKTLFTGEAIRFDDLCETKNVVQGVMYLDFTEGEEDADISEMVHVGRTGSYVPVEDGGGHLWRIKDDQRYAVSGTKGYKWIERDMAGDREETGELRIDMAYFENLVSAAKEAIEEYGSYEQFKE